jgi:hypothetical protein
MALAVFIGGNAKKERWAIKPMLRAKLRQLFRRCLIAQNGNRRIAGHQLNQQSDQRNDSPDYEH